MLPMSDAPCNALHVIELGDYRLPDCLTITVLVCRCLLYSCCTVLKPEVSASNSTLLLHATFCCYLLLATVCCSVFL